MNCPKCSAPRVLQGAGDGALRCPSCGGLWVSANVFAQSLPPPLADERPLGGPPTADQKGGMCPAGHAILSRARVDALPPFWLERCPVCEGIWFDAGEWTRLAAPHVLGLLPRLWDDQRRLERSREQSDQHHRVRLVAQFGEETVAALEEIGDRYAGDPRQGQLIAYFAELLRKR